MPYAKLFRSRWAALLWAAGILCFAFDVAGTGDPPANGTARAPVDVTGTPLDNADLAAFASVMNDN